jgi:methenyltetrahydrofolate cyclohydrolase
MRTDPIDMSETLWTLTLRDFLSATASAQPTPGGGSVACVTAAYGLGLVIMALEISRKRKDVARPAEIDELIAEARPLLDLIAAAADADIAAFRDYMAALRLPKETGEQKRRRSTAMQEAVVRATESPLAAARLMVGALQLATRALPLTHAHVVSDVAAGAGLLDGALTAVLLNVDINLPGLTDTAFQAECETARVHLAKEGAALAADLQRAAARALAGHTEIITGKP